MLLLREVQRLSQEDGVNLSGIKQILELGAELDRARRLLSEMTTEIAQLRAELESTRAVAARLAGLVRNRTGAQLVPVRNLRGGAAPTGPAAPEQVPPATGNASTGRAASSGAPAGGAENSSAPFEESR